MVGADKEDAAKKQKGSKSLPKGVIETGRNTIKYQARDKYNPDGSFGREAKLDLALRGGPLHIQAWIDVAVVSPFICTACIQY